MYQAYTYNQNLRRQPFSNADICIFIDLNKKSSKQTIKNLISRGFEIRSDLLLPEPYSASKLELVNIYFHTPNLTTKYYGLYDKYLQIVIPIEMWQFVKNTLPSVNIINGIVQETLKISYGTNFLDSSMNYVPTK